MQSGGSYPDDLPALAGHVLAVESNSLNRLLIGAYLDEFGLTHEMAESGASAIMRLAVTAYDLVLLDTTMPDLDGVEGAKHFRGLHGPAALVPIVALVTTRMKGCCANYLAAGMNTYVLKPILPRELHAALMPFLATRQRAEPAALAV
ncbi:MAG: response regulator [Methyloceanibacter sp.]